MKNYEKYFEFQSSKNQKNLRNQSLIIQT